MSEGPALGSLFRRAPKPFLAIMYKFFAPLLPAAAPQASVIRAGTLQRHQRALPLAWLAVAAAAAGRLGILCFSPLVPERLAGHSAGRASTRQGKAGRVTLHEAMDYQSTRLLAVSHQDASPKRRLLQALLTGRSGAAEVEGLVAEVQTQSQGVGGPAALDRTWRLLSSGLSDSRFPTPELAFYKGGNFLHEGGIQNGGLFKAILQKEAAQLQLGIPRVTFSGLNMKVSAAVEVAPGREKTLSYSAQLKFLSPTTFQRVLTTLDLPDPAGSLTPLIEVHEIIEVVYSDDDLLILRDESGHTEVLAQNSAETLVFLGESGEFMGLSDLFLDSHAPAMSH